MNGWKYDCIYQYLKELYHGRAVMITVMLSFVSACVQKDDFQQRKWSPFFFLYMHRKTIGSHVLHISWDAFVVTLNLKVLETVLNFVP